MSRRSDRLGFGKTPQERVSYDPRGRRYIRGEAEHRAFALEPISKKPFPLNRVTRDDGREVRLGDRVWIEDEDGGPYEVVAITGWPAQSRGEADVAFAALEYRGSSQRYMRTRERVRVDRLVYVDRAGPYR